MKQLIFNGEEPVEILDRSYVTNIQMPCDNEQEILTVISTYIDKYWGDFKISRGGNETRYTGYILESIVIDIIGGYVVHFILTKGTSETNENDEYAEAGRILLGEIE